jgi:hypothetical protein
VVDLELADRIARKERHRGMDREDVRQVALLVMLEKGPDWDPARGTYADHVGRWTRHRCQVASGCRRAGRKAVAHVAFEDTDAHAHEDGASPEALAIFGRACARRVAFGKRTTTDSTVGEVLARVLAGADVVDATGASSRAEASRRWSEVLNAARG